MMKNILIIIIVTITTPWAYIIGSLVDGAWALGPLLQNELI
jgi:hypothetical protein